MKLFCNKTLLQQAMSIIQKAIATKSPLPIITGVYLHAANNQLELQATDYQLAITYTIDATVEEPGTAVVAGRYFQELVKRLPGDNVEIASSPEDSTLYIACDSSKFNLLTFPAEDFPVIEKISNNDNQFTVNEMIIRDSIKKTIFACSNDETRPIFTGGLLEIDNDIIRLVATNTHRLAMKKTPVPPIDNKISMIIPAKLLGELARISNAETDINVVWEKGKIAFIFNNIYLQSRLIEGKFPDYNTVIPKTFATTAIVNVKEFLDAVERVSLMAKEGQYNIIKFNFEQDNIVLQSNNPDIGKASETIAAAIEGKPINIAFNAKYISDVLKIINEGQIKILLNDDNGTTCIQPLTDDTYLYLVTPIKTA